MKRLTAKSRAELEQRRERLQLELQLVEVELRADEALRLQDRGRPAEERGRLGGRWRDCG
jgi:ribose 1,5-bisphosphokinase PhnN